MTTFMELSSRFKLAENGRLSCITAVGPSGAELKIEAREVVVSAGAIESTRLLLLLDAQHGNSGVRAPGLARPLLLRSSGDRRRNRDPN